MKRIKEITQTIFINIMNKKLLTTADCNNVSYRSPEVSVTEIFAEGVLCASAKSASFETWNEEELQW